MRAAAPPSRVRRQPALFAPFLGLVLFLLAGTAAAQWSGSVGADSEYRFRGISLSGTNPALRAAANYDAPGGWYGGASVTQAEVDQPGDRYAQLLAYGGHVMPFGSATLDLGLSGSVFLGEHRYDFVEASAGLLFASGSIRASFSPSYFGWHMSTLYLDASGHIPLPHSARLFGHVGVLAPLSGARLPFPFAEANRARADVRAGLGWTVRDFDFTLSWNAATRGGPPPTSPELRQGRWVVGATWFF